MAGESRDGFGDLIEVLEILHAYETDAPYPTNCSHDVMWFNVNPESVQRSHIGRLRELGVEPGEGDHEGGFVSFRFGSC